MRKPCRRRGIGRAALPCGYARESPGWCGTPSSNCRMGSSGGSSRPVVEAEGGSPASAAFLAEKSDEECSMLVRGCKHECTRKRWEFAAGSDTSLPSEIGRKYSFTKLAILIVGTKKKYFKQCIAMTIYLVLSNWRSC